jgi:hypothetical protein
MKYIIKTLSIPKQYNVCHKTKQISTIDAMLEAVLKHGCKNKA